MFSQNTYIISLFESPLFLTFWFGFESFLTPSFIYAEKFVLIHWKVNPIYFHHLAMLCMKILMWCLPWLLCLTGFGLLLQLLPWVQIILEPLGIHQHWSEQNRVKNQKIVNHEGHHGGGGSSNSQRKILSQYRRGASNIFGIGVCFNSPVSQTSSGLGFLKCLIL